MAAEAIARVFLARRLETFIADVLVAVRLPEPDAAVCAARMTEADLRGVSTHGIFRLPHYCQRIRVGGINLRPTARPVRENAVTALVYGDNGMGHVVLPFATQLAIRKATESGLAWVGTFNGNHAGAEAVYATMPVARDMIGMYMTVQTPITWPRGAG